jgi:hypothetical protein
MLDYIYFFIQKNSTHSLFLEIRVIRIQLPKTKQVILVMKILKPPFTMSRNMEQDMKLYSEKSLIWLHLDVCVEMTKCILNIIMFKEGTHGLIFILYTKKLNNASRPHQPYTAALVESQVTQK